MEKTQTETPAPESQKATVADFLLMHGIVVLWGFTAILGALCSIAPLDIVWWRTGMAVVAMWALFWRRLDWANATRSLKMGLLYNGVFIATHWYLFFLAARVGNVSSCLAGLATGSLWTALLEPLVEKRRMAMPELVSGMVVLLGLGIIFYEQADAAAGVLLGILSAAFAALFSVFNKGFVRKSNAYIVSTIGLTGAFLASGLCMLGSYAFGLRPHLLPSMPMGNDWLWIAILALLCTVFAFTATVNLLKRFSAFTANLAVNMEPIYGILLAYAFFGQAEAMTTGFYIGTGIIILAVLGHPLADWWRARQIIEVR